MIDAAGIQTTPYPGAFMLFGVAMNFFISFFLSLFMSVATPVVTGDPILLADVIMGTLLGTAIGTVFSSVVPVNPIGRRFAEKCGAVRNSLAWYLLKDVALVTMMLLAITFCLTAINTGFSAGFADRWLGPLPQLWPIAYILIIQVEPVCVWLSSKVVRKHVPHVEQ